MDASHAIHIPVLLHESIDGLAINAGDTIVDGTFGGGGHSQAIVDQFGGSIELVCVDLDEDAQMRFESTMKGVANATFVHANFKDAKYILETAAKGKVDKVLLDLGTSTFQLLNDTRGFSFQSNTPLSMSFSQQESATGITAWDIANSWEETTIADIIYAYGQDRSARRIARAIVLAREHGPIATSGKLAEIISHAVPRRGRIHPATKTFQAFRIAANDELGVLKDALARWWEKLAPNGRIAVITFHSLEDRIVKQWMKAQTNERVITKKPICPSVQELQINPRSRSAKLRIIEKIIE